MKIIVKHIKKKFSTLITDIFISDTLGSFSHSVNTIKDNRSYKQKNFKVDEPDKVSDYKVNHLKPYGICGAEVALTHTETLHTTLTRENGTFGLQFIDSPDGRVLINSMTPDGPAERCETSFKKHIYLNVNIHFEEILFQESVSTPW